MEQYTPLQKHWVYIAKKRGLTVDVPYSVHLSDGKSLTVEVRLQNYGAKKGMLIVSSYALIDGKTDELIKMGYGYSCMSEPSDDNIESDEGLDDVLKDWELS